MRCIFLLLFLFSFSFLFFLLNFWFRIVCVCGRCRRMRQKGMRRKISLTQIDVITRATYISRFGNITILHTKKNYNINSAANVIWKIAQQFQNNTLGWIYIILVVWMKSSRFVNEKIAKKNGKLIAKKETKWKKRVPLSNRCDQRKKTKLQMLFIVLFVGPHE